MVDLALIVGLSVVYALSFAYLAIHAIWQLEKQRAEWRVERDKLLDRIQAGSFTEFKAQERAETPIKRKEKDPLVARLDGEPWL